MRIPLDFKENGPTLHEVLFDEDFLGGLKLRCSSNRAYRLPASCLLSISHGRRLSGADGENKRSHKSHAHSGTSYADAASVYEQQPSYGRGQLYGNGNGKYQGRGGSAETRTEYGNRSERPPKSGRDKSRGRVGGDEVKKILLRNPSDSSHKSRQESGHGDMSAAVDALSNLTISNQPALNETVNLSPSVAAMFSAHKKKETLPEEDNTDAGKTSMQDHSSNLKSILRIGGPNKPPVKRDLPEAVQQPSQPRGPLLPRPPQYPPQQARGVQVFFFTMQVHLVS